MSRYAEKGPVSVPMGAESPISVRARGLIATALHTKGIDLPALSSIASEIMAIASLFESDAAELAKTIRRDEGLAATLIRVANSPSFAPLVEIRSLQQAVSRLGLKMIGELVLMITLRDSVFSVPGHEEWMSSLWKHALATACYTREITRARRQTGQHDFLCGLLHDSGAPLVLNILTRHSASLPVVLGTANLHVLMQEFHAEAGALLGVHWGLPQVVIDAMTHHQTPHLATNHMEMVATVALADQLAHIVHDDAGEISAEELMGDDIITTLHLHVADLRAVMEKHEFVARVVSDLG